jgi:hemoglobin/transferrin/lactoferrin receptor protein
MTNRRLLFSLLLLTTTALGTTLAVPAMAQTQPPTQTQAQPTQLDAVTTAATRNRRPIDAVPGTVSVITTEDIDRENMQNMRDLVRNEPGVSVGNNPGRAGFTNFVIRGIGGNRVLVMVDGMRVPDYPGSNQGPGLYTRDFVDLENVKRVEIIRGPASALYGSDALGGVVAYITKDPSDYLVPGGKDVYASAKVAYDSSNYSFAETFTGAVRQGPWEMLGLYTRRDGHNTQIKSSLYEPNPQNAGENNFLAKFVLRPSDHDTIRVVGEYVEKSVKTQVLSSVGNFQSLFANIFDQWANDRTQRYRLSAQWVHEAPIGFIDRLDFMAYYSAVARQEDAMELRGPFNGLTPTNFRTSSHWYTQDIAGAELQLDSAAEIFGLHNAFTYGLSFSYTMTSRPRFRQQVTMATGATTNVVAGEAFPNKNFPDTQTAQAGIYLQDEITAGRLTVTPAIRLDYYNLRPNPDGAFWRSSGAINVLPSESTYWSASPKLGLLYRFTDEYSGFFQYARGFRAPPYDNANFAFTNVTSFYQILPNANLRPETSDSFEIGVRGKYKDGSSFALSGFYNLFNDFIDTVTVASGPPPALTVFQFQNLSNVTIWGFEARGEYRVRPEWALLGYFAYAKGTDNATGLPIDSVDPWKLQGRVRYGTGTGFGAQLIGTVVGQHDQVSNPTYFQAPSYFNLDATVSYDWNRIVTVNAGAFNITNAQYWNAQDVIGVAANNAQLQRLTQPGRYFGVNLTARW